MSWAFLFQLVNTTALLLWLVLILAPRRFGTIGWLRVAGAGGLSLFYVALVATIFPRSPASARFSRPMAGSSLAGLTIWRSTCSRASGSPRMPTGAGSGG